MILFGGLDEGFGHAAKVGTSYGGKTADEAQVLGKTVASAPV